MVLALCQEADIRDGGCLGELGNIRFRAGRKRGKSTLNGRKKRPVAALTAPFLGSHNACVALIVGGGMLRTSISALIALFLAAPAWAMSSAAPLGSVASQTEPASSQSSPALTLRPLVAVPTPAGLSQPDWVRMPTGDELARLTSFYARGQQPGTTKMQCRVLKDGTLTDCAVIQEDPPHRGFGKAALASARYFKMAPTTTDGKPAEGMEVVLPMRWLPPPPSPTDP